MNRITFRDERDFLYWRPGSGKTVEIYDIVVMSQRRKGIGRWLINRLIDHEMPADTKLVYAITRISNGIAKAFYEEMGFRVIGNLWRFYQDESPSGEPRKYNIADAVMYGRDVGPDAPKLNGGDK